MDHRAARTRLPRRAWPPIAVAIALISVTPHADASPRFPRWPTEVDRVASPLYSRATQSPATDRVRAQSVIELGAFATPVIEAPLLFALDDPAVQVRREALRLCFERAVGDCIDGAATLYNDGAEPSLKIAALKVLSLDSRPRSASILIAALRDPSEGIRAQAAELISSAPLGDTMADKARAALLAKLPDVSAVVRRAAVRSLGLLGPGDGALAIARVLDDPAPAVRAAAAVALGRMRDERVVSALRRAVRAPNEPLVAKALVEALARLESEDHETDLLALVDDPPPGLNSRLVAAAIARRPRVGPTLVQGLIDRLREPSLAAPCLHALLVLGNTARPGIEAVLARGVEAPIEIELTRLLAALDPTPPASQSVHRPRPDDADAWVRELTSVGPDKLTAALDLGRLAPSWLGPSAGARLADAVSPDAQRPWLVAIASASHALSLGDSQRRTVARLLTWASDRTLPRADRCLTILALGSLAANDDLQARAGIVDALSSARAQLRVCAVAVGQHAGLPAAMLEPLAVDPDPRVRASAALALSGYEADAHSLTVATRLAVMEHRDPSGEVRRAAKFARRAEAPTSAAPQLRLGAPVAQGWTLPQRWQAIDSDARAEAAASTLWLPTIGMSQHRWLVLPAGAHALLPAEPRVDE